MYSMFGFHKVKKALKKNEKAWEFIEKNPYIIDKIIESLCFEKTDEKSKESMLKNGVPEYIIEDCLNISSQKFIHISCKALQKIIPFIIKGETYDKACLLAGYNFKAEKRDETYKKLPTINKFEDTIKNPVVLRTMAQLRKVINAIISKYGKVD